MLPADGGTAATSQQQADHRLGNVEYAYRFFISKGLSPQAAAGIVGNLKAESGVDPTNNQNDGGPGRGIAQWSAGGRWDQLLAWANSRGYNPNLLDTQLSYVWRELNTSYKGVLQRLQSASTVQEASNAFLHDYESPADQSASVEQYRANLGMDAYQAHPAKPLPSGAVPSGDIGVTRGMGDVAYYGTGGGGGNVSPGQDTLDPHQLAAQAGWSYEFLKSQPELWKVFQQAINKGWTPDKFVSAVRDTDWFQTHADTIRQAQILKSTDPATWDQRKSQMSAAIMDQARGMGAVINQAQADHAAEQALKFGWQPGDANLQNVLSGYIHRVQGSFVGQAGSVEDQLSQFASDMGVPMGSNWVKNAVVGIANGQWDMNRAQDHIRRMAMSAFPSFRDDLESNPNMTMRDIASPYMQSYASILEKNPAEVSLMTPEIRKALTMRDDKGKATAQSLWDFETSLRKSPEWASTKNGTEEILSGVQGVLKDFGFGW